MLKKAMIASLKEFRISIGSMSNCTVTVSKQHAMAGEVITVTVHVNAGYGNTKVSVTGVQVTQVNDTTFTFVMPFSDVVVSATASVQEFAIYVNQSGTGTVSVKQTARYGETVSVTVSPGGGFRLSSIWGDGTSVSGSGNNYSFVMPANNVTIHVAFEDMRVVLTCGRVVGESGMPGYENHQGYHSGSLNRVPYWESRDKYLTQFFARWDWHTVFFLGPQQNETLECSFKTIYVNGQPFTLSGGGDYQRAYLNEGNNKLGLRDGMVITLIFDPPLQDSSKVVLQAFTRSLKEGVVNATQGIAIGRSRGKTEVSSRNYQQYQLDGGCNRRWQRNRGRPKKYGEHSCSCGRGDFSGCARLEWRDASTIVQRFEERKDMERRFYDPLLRWCYLHKNRRDVGVVSLRYKEVSYVA